MSRILMVIAPEGFRDEELFEARDALAREGHDIVIASSRTGPCTGSRGGVATAETTLDALDPAAFDAVVFVGGGGAKRYFDDARAHAIAQQMYGAGKLVTAICAAPVILAKAGLLRGRTATVFGRDRAAMEAGGAIYAGPGVAVDGTIITADGPKNARRFGERIGEALRAPRPDLTPPACRRSGTDLPR